MALIRSARPWRLSHLAIVGAAALRGPAWTEGRHAVKDG